MVVEESGFESIDARRRRRIGMVSDVGAITKDEKRMKDGPGVATANEPVGMKRHALQTVYESRRTDERAADQAIITVRYPQKQP